MRKSVKTWQRYWVGDCLIAWEFAIIGITEVAHLASVLLGRPFSDCIIIMPVLIFALLIAFVGHEIVRKYSGVAAEKGEGANWGKVEWVEWILYAASAVLLLTQLFVVLRGDGVYRQGDMTVETVNSFLEADAVYSVNPLTGQAYAEGIPSRIKILCLPTLYGSICLATGLSPRFVVWRLIPALTLISSYLAFWLLARSLFPKDEKKSATFLVCYGLLLWVETYRYGMDGFGLLFCGFRGVTIRNVVLLPWMISLLLRKRWIAAFFCIVAEACIVWTFYGMGVCAAVTVGMALAELAVKIFASGKEAA